MAGEGGRTRTRVQSLTLLGVCLAQGMIVLDLMIVNVALPSIQRELQMGPSTLEWVVSAYALALATLIPLGGALGDRYGRKRLFLCGMTLFVAASAACALSTSDGQLIGFRVVQGVGGAVMTSLTLSMISEAFAPEERAGPISLWAAVSGLGVAGGTVVGGLLLSVFSWSSVFWVNVPLGMVASVVVLVGVRESKDEAGRPLDVPGVVLSAVALAALTFGFIEAADLGWGSPVVWTACLCGAVGLAVFGAWERRSPAPMVPRPLAAARPFRAACTVYFLAYLSFIAFIYYATLLFQDVRGWSPLETGLSWLTFCVPYFVTAQLGGRLQTRFPPAVLVGAGCLTAGLATGAMAFLTTTTPVPLLAAGYLAIGVGFGLMVPAGGNAAMSEVPPGYSGVASGIFNASRQVGTSVGLGLLGAVGVHVAERAWNDRVAGLGAASRATADGLGADVAGGRVSTVTRALGPHAGTSATEAFLHGYEAAVLGAGVMMLLAAVVGYRGLRIRHRVAPTGPVVPAGSRVAPAGS